MANHIETAHGSPAGGHVLGQPLHCIVVTPEATVLEANGEFVALPLLDGEMGIARGHSPMIGRLGHGEMRLVDQGQTRRFYIDGGFVQIADNVISVLTNRAIPAEKIDAAAAAQQLEAARSQVAHSPESMMARERAQQQARAQLRIAGRNAGSSLAAASRSH